MKNIEPILFNDMDGGEPILISGPCSAESERQVMDTAEALAMCGIRIFRAGIWKPRTKPGCFEGVGSEGLQWLRKVKETTGMYVATEVANKSHVLEALSSGIDLLWIGARTTANPFAMQEIADSIESLGTDVPVLVKNPVNPDIELWIGGMQRLYNAGVRRIGAIHRGFSVYGNHIYRNQPQWHLPIELRRRYPDLPIIHDPSHVGGKREFIASLSQQALDMGFDGLIIESHCNPEQALSDSEQQVTPQELKKIVLSLVRRDKSQSTESLNQLRQQIDELDRELVEVLSKRMGVCREIGLYKKERGLSIVQSKRYDELLSSRLDYAANSGLSPEFLKKVLESVHSESVRQQIEVFKN